MLLALLLLFFMPLCGDITVDLREPVLQEGTLSTCQGGVIAGPNFRLQAENIAYTKKSGVHKVVASRFVMVDFGDYIFIGDSLEYDFETETGVIENGVSRHFPWYFGGERIEILPDGCYIIYNAYVTTSESACPDWKMQADRVVINRDRTLDLSQIQMRFVELPFFWLPSFKINLSSLTEAPIRFYALWGGRQGIRVGLKYALWEYNRFKTYLRLDWRFRKGPGVGLETYYASEDGKHTLETINYYAKDNSRQNLHQKTRFRVQGIYTNSFSDDHITVRASWDKLSDKDMATDYKDRGIELDTAGRTELLIRQEDPWLISNLTARVRINQFQTLKQELPSLLYTQRPYVLGASGILVENQAECAYLNFKYANDLNNKANNYSSPRAYHHFRISKPLHPPGINITPEGGMRTMLYSNSRHHHPRFLIQGTAGIKASASLFRRIGDAKHVLYPYFDWQYISAPTVNPDDHYIFDIYDGLWRVHSCRIGLRQSLISGYSDCALSCALSRPLELDLFTYLFTDSVPIQKLYGNLTWYPSAAFRQTLQSGWDFTVNQMNHFNLLNEWTLSPNSALMFEYRHRSRFCYRKAVWDNFNMESWLSTRRLINSRISDKRNTLLCHYFWRPHPLFALNFVSRLGWGRERHGEKKHKRWERPYGEFEIDLIARLPSYWCMKLSYDHTEAQDRIVASFSLDLTRPNKDTCDLLLPIDF